MGGCTQRVKIGECTELVKLLHSPLADAVRALERQNLDLKVLRRRFPLLLLRAVLQDDVCPQRHSHQDRLQLQLRHPLSCKMCEECGSGERAMTLCYILFK